MSRARIASRLGDVFVVPISAGMVAVGQIVATYMVKGCYYVVIFNGSLPMDEISVETLNQSIASGISLIALTLDGKLFSGEWRIVGSRPVVDVELPAYKVSRIVDGQPTHWVEDYSGKRTRQASETEAESLLYRRTTAPAGVEMAVLALFGNLPWEPRFDSMRPGSQLSPSSLAPPL